MSNATIELLCQHRSIRAYQHKSLTSEQINAIIKAAQSGSSSSLMQCSTIIRVTNADYRQQIAYYAGEQNYVQQAAEFWVFCADFNRHQQIDASLALGKAEQLLVGCVDTAIMAQNAVIAAESLGLGCVYIGGIRNNIDKITTLLKLPKFVLPLFGICIGYPDQDPKIKPRLPQQAICFENEYQSISKAQIAAYDQQMHEYYTQRSSNQKTGGWSDKLAMIVNKEQRDFMLDYLHKQGWVTR